MGRKAGVTADETRAKLLNAAAAVFAERGYDGTRVSEIARRAGVTTGAIYAHYGNKAELLAEVVRRHGSPELERLLAGDDVDVAVALRAAGRQLAEPDTERPMLAMEAIAACRRDPDVATVLLGGVTAREAVLAQAIRRARAAGTVDATLDPHALARFCTLIALGAATAGALGLAAPDEDEWAGVVDRVIDAILVKEDP